MAIPNIKILLREVVEARVKWRYILMELDVSDGDVDAIAEKHTDTLDCLNKGLTEWLRGGERKWQEIVDALCSPMVGFRQLADNIKSKHMVEPEAPPPASTPAAVPTAAAPMTLEQLVANTKGLNDHKLDKLIEETHTYKLSQFFDTVEGYIDYMNFKPGEKTDIKDKAHLKGTALAMNEALKAWRKPNPFQATFKALLEIVLSMNKGDVAVEIAKYVASLEF